MAISLLLVLVSIVFLTLKILEPSRRQYLCKTSIMVVLFYGLEGWNVSDSQSGGAVQTATDTELHARAKAMTAEFRKNDEGSLKPKKTENNHAQRRKYAPVVQASLLVIQRVSSIVVLHQGGSRFAHARRFISFLSAPYS
jgi:hypothetical protein